jgi:hypothetical protein
LRIQDANCFFAGLAIVINVALFQAPKNGNGKCEAMYQCIRLQRESAQEYGTVIVPRFETFLCKLKTSSPKSLLT